MAKGGTQTTKPYIPTYGEELLQQSVMQAQDLAPLQNTYTPMYGPQVAAKSPREQLSQQYTDIAAGAFGMPTVQTDSYLPEAQTYEGGIQGYSARPMVEGMISQFQAERPAQAEYRESFGIDPVSGEYGSRAPQSYELKPLELQGGKGGK